MVVQPSVEFGDDSIFDCQTQNTQPLVRWIEAQPSLVFEAHSTDYRTRENLRTLVRDHFAILKVGSAPTFAFRQAVFALAHIEEHLFSPTDQSHLMQVIEQVMLEHPQHWKKYYDGTPLEEALKRKFSLSNRIRAVTGAIHPSRFGETAGQSREKDYPKNRFASPALPSLD